MGPLSEVPRWSLTETTGSGEIKSHVFSPQQWITIRNAYINNVQSPKWIAMGSDQEVHQLDQALQNELDQIANQPLSPQQRLRRVDPSSREHIYSLEISLSNADLGVLVWSPVAQEA
jgi:hypothetical protein